MHTAIPWLEGRDGRLPVSDDLAGLAKQYAPGSVRDPIAKSKSPDIDLWSPHAHVCTWAHTHSYQGMRRRTGGASITHSAGRKNTFKYSSPQSDNHG